jgi:hypothetical protein
MSEFIQLLDDTLVSVRNIVKVTKGFAGNHCLPLDDYYYVVISCRGGIKIEKNFDEEEIMLEYFNDVHYKLFGE